MSVQTPLAANDPRMIAWEVLKQTEEYQNSRRWTIKAETDEQADGELWFAFEFGWRKSADFARAERKRVYDEVEQTINSFIEKLRAGTSAGGENEK